MAIGLPIGTRAESHACPDVSRRLSQHFGEVASLTGPGCNGRVFFVRVSEMTDDRQQVGNIQRIYRGYLPNIHPHPHGYVNKDYILPGVWTARQNACGTKGSPQGSIRERSHARNSARLDPVANFGGRFFGFWLCGAELISHVRIE
jgi:hypothetical protein